MTETRDAELFFLKFEALIKANLNNKIIEINTEKGDSLLDAVNSNAYYYMTWGQSTPDYDPVVVFAVNTEVKGEHGGLTAETLRLLTEITISSKGEADSTIVFKRIQRYRRALIEIVQEGYRGFPATKIESFPELPFTIDRDLFYATGVGVEFSYPTS